MGVQRALMMRGDVQRAYMNAGDPGLFSFLKRATRIPKGVRKFQPGKFVRKYAAPALSLIPGVGGVIGSFLPGKVGPVMQEAITDEGERFFGGLDPRVIELLRYYGGGDPGMFDNLKRLAGMGATMAQVPHAKAADPRAVTPRDRPTAAQKAADLAAKVLQNLTPAGKFLGAAAPGIAKLVGYPSGAPGMPGAGRGRRSMNPTNVRALRRSLRRVEGFKNMVKRVEKQFPAMRSRPHLSSHGQRQHRAGCGCVICKRSR